MSRGLKPLDQQRKGRGRESRCANAHPFLAGRGKPGTDEIRGKHGIGHYTGGET